MNNSEDILDILGLSPAGARIFRYFLVRADANPHLRELQRTLSLGMGSVQRELQRMVELGALKKAKEGRRTVYSVDESASIWKAIRILESSTGDPSYLIEDALVDVSGLEAAFIFGSVARGEQREDSDIDLLVVESPQMDRKKLLRQLGEVGFVLGREVNAVRYTPQALAERLGDVSHPGWGFVREVLTGPKRWVGGTVDALIPLATAAGLKPRDLSGSAA